MTFRRADFGWLLSRRAEGWWLLSYLVQTRHEADVEMVETARLLGALDHELSRRRKLTAAVVEAFELRQGVS